MGSGAQISNLTSDELCCQLKIRLFIYHLLKRKLFPKDHKREITWLIALSPSNIHLPKAPPMENLHAKVVKEERGIKNECKQCSRITWKLLRTARLIQNIGVSAHLAQLSKV